MPPRKDEKLCGHCEKAVTKEGIQCDICDGWWHPLCAGIKSEICEFLGQNKQVHWYCIKCNSGVGTLIKEIKKMQDRLLAVEENARKVTNKMDSLRESICKEVDIIMQDVKKELNERPAELEIRQMIAEEMKKLNEKTGSGPSWSEIVSKEVGSRLTVMADDLSVVQKGVIETKEKIIENEDKLKRLNNIIMYNVEESRATSQADRNNDDMEFCARLMKTVLKVGYEKGDISKVVRLGKKSEDTSDVTSKRPLLVEFGNAHVKNVVMTNVTNLRLANDEFKGVSISHDMTINERQQCKDLVEEARKIQSQELGNFVYRVRGLPGQMKIVKFSKN
jgi:hypothetical protein